MLIEKDHLVPEPAWTTSLASRGTHKDSYNSSVTKICSVGFNHDDKLLCKQMKSKDQAILEIFYVK